MNILSISLIVFVVALNSSSACGLEQFVKTKVTTPKSTACGGALRLLAPYLTKNTPHRRLHYNHYARDSVPSASRERFMDFISAASSLFKDFVPSSSGGITGMRTHYLNNEPRYLPIYSPPRYQAPSTSEGTSGSLAPYFVNTFANLLPRYQAPSTSEGTGGLRTPYFAHEPRYLPIQPPPVDRVSSAPGGPLGSLTHYFDEILRNALLDLLLRNKLPSASGGSHRFRFHIHGGRSITVHRGSNKPPHHQPKATHRKFGPDYLTELLRQIMSHRSTNSRTAFKPSTTNGNKAMRHARIRPHVLVARRPFPRTVFRPVNTHQHKPRLSQTRPGQRLSQHQPTRVSQEGLFPRTIFTPLTFNP